MSYLTQNHDALDACQPPPTPSCALVFYTANSGQLAALMHHRIQTWRGAPTLDAGRPLGPDDEHAIRSLLEGRQPDAGRGFLPAGMLAEFSASHVVWWLPAARRVIHLIDSDGNYHAPIVDWPSLVFRAKGDELAVAALTHTDPPRPEDVLSHAPLGNVYHDGRICLGNVRAPERQGRDSIARWTEVFVSSNFTHANHDTWVHPSGKAATPTAFWLARAGQKRPKPWRDLLVPMQTTLGHWSKA